MGLFSVVPLSLLSVVSLTTTTVVSAKNWSSYSYVSSFSYAGQQQASSSSSSSLAGEVLSSNCISFKVEPPQGKTQNNGPLVETFGLPYVSEESYMFYEYSIGGGSTWMVDLQDWASSFASFGSGTDKDSISAMSGCQAIDHSGTILKSVKSQILSSYQALLANDAVLFQVDDNGNAFKSQKERDSYIKAYLAPYSKEGGVPLYWGPICARSSRGVSLGVFLDSTCTIYVPYLESVVHTYIKKNGKSMEDLATYSSMVTTVLNDAYKYPVNCAPPTTNDYTTYGASDENDVDGERNDEEAATATPTLNEYCTAVMANSIDIDTCEPMDSASSAASNAEEDGTSATDQDAIDEVEATSGANSTTTGYLEGQWGAGYQLTQQDLTDLKATCYAVEVALAPAVEGGRNSTVWEELDTMEEAYDVAVSEARAFQSSNGGVGAMTISAMSGLFLAAVAIGALVVAVATGMVRIKKVPSRRPDNRKQEEENNTASNPETFDTVSMVSNNTKKEPLLIFMDTSDNNVV
jgi:hypothetical protein